MALLDRLVPDQAQAPPRAKTLSSYLIKVARLGGYLARTRDPPPGNTVLWRGIYTTHRHRPRREAREPRTEMWGIERRRRRF